MTGAGRSFLGEFRSWPARRWFFAAGTAGATVLIVAIPTDLIDTPWFTRDIPPTWWAWPVLVLTAVLSGLVAATYVARKDGRAKRDARSRFGVLGAFATFFAVGCPVCNKLVLLALGYSGAISYFQPVQPYLAAGAVVLLGWALAVRVRRERSCLLPG